MIRKETAQKIAKKNWNYCNSALEQLGKTGDYLLENHLRYLQEVETALHPEYNLFPCELSYLEQKSLENLAAWVEETGKNHGLITFWEKHSVYGYRIPYIAEEVSDDLANKVKQISYMK
jgi:hypothetical protein